MPTHHYRVAAVFKPQAGPNCAPLIDVNLPIPVNQKIIHEI